RRMIEDERNTPFDLEREPLMRASLLRLAEEDHILLITMHHIITDGWSTEILVREAATLYEAFAAGRMSPLAELPFQYVDYAQWQLHELEGEMLEQQLSYWKRQLAGIPPGLEIAT